jgi:hypothetical protein
MLTELGASSTFSVARDAADTSSIWRSWEVDAGLRRRGVRDGAARRCGSPEGDAHPALAHLGVDDRGREAHGATVDLDEGVALVGADHQGAGDGRERRDARVRSRGRDGPRPRRRADTLGRDVSVCGPGGARRAGAPCTAPRPRRRRAPQRPATSPSTRRARGCAAGAPRASPARGAGRRPDGGGLVAVELRDDPHGPGCEGERARGSPRGGRGRGGRCRAWRPAGSVVTRSTAT